ncbi:MAG TPA: NADAR family protein [Kineosporiaceae bacterium]|nr:NADAR family protein [Kineosporiaceae bacterium]
MHPDDHLRHLLEAEAAGELPPLLPFWGHRPRADGRIGTACLSQWWPSPFTVDGVEYGTAEHWMMAGKARLFGDETALDAVLAAGTPGAAKAAGRTVRDFDEKAWREARYGLVVEGNRHKFTQHPELGRYLLGTAPAVLVEASPVDRIWGIGLAAADEAVGTPSRWRGLNLLGFALVDVRQELATAADTRHV